MEENIRDVDDSLDDDNDEEEEEEPTEEEELEEEYEKQAWRNPNRLLGSSSTTAYIEFVENGFVGKINADEAKRIRAVCSGIYPVGQEFDFSDIDWVTQQREERAKVLRSILSLPPEKRAIELFPFDFFPGYSPEERRESGDFSVHEVPKDEKDIERILNIEYPYEPLVNIAF